MNFIQSGIVAEYEKVAKELGVDHGGLDGVEYMDHGFGSNPERIEGLTLTFEVIVLLIMGICNLPTLPRLGRPLA
jgi:uncharacterized membrane protein